MGACCAIKFKKQQPKIESEVKIMPRLSLIPKEQFDKKYTKGSELADQIKRKKTSRHERKNYIQGDNPESNQHSSEPQVNSMKVTDTLNDHSSKGKNTIQHNSDEEDSQTISEHHSENVSNSNELSKPVDDYSYEEAQEIETLSNYNKSGKLISFKKFMKRESNKELFLEKKDSTKDYMTVMKTIMTDELKIFDYQKFVKEQKLRKRKKVCRLKLEDANQGIFEDKTFIANLNKTDRIERRNKKNAKQDLVRFQASNILDTEEAEKNQISLHKGEIIKVVETNNEKAKNIQPSLPTGEPNIITVRRKGNDAENKSNPNSPFKKGEDAILEEKLKKRLYIAHNYEEYFLEMKRRGNPFITEAEIAMSKNPYNRDAFNITNNEMFNNRVCKENTVLNYRKIERMFKCKVGEFLQNIWVEKGSKLSFFVEGEYAIGSRFLSISCFGAKSLEEMYEKQTRNKMNSDVKARVRASKSTLIQRFPHINFGALMGRVGAESTYFPVSNYHIYTAKESGPLLLSLNFLNKNFKYEDRICMGDEDLPLIGKFNVSVFGALEMSERKIFEKVNMLLRKEESNPLSDDPMLNDLFNMLNRVRREPKLFVNHIAKVLSNDFLDHSIKKMFYFLNTFEETLQPFKLVKGFRENKLKSHMQSNLNLINDMEKLKFESVKRYTESKSILDKFMKEAGMDKINKFQVDSPIQARLEERAQVKSVPAQVGSGRQLENISSNIESEEVQSQRSKSNQDQNSEADDSENLSRSDRNIKENPNSNKMKIKNVSDSYFRNSSKDSELQDDHNAEDDSNLKNDSQLNLKSDEVIETYRLPSDSSVVRSKLFSESKLEEPESEVERKAEQVKNFNNLINKITPAKEYTYDYKSNKAITYEMPYSLNSYYNVLQLLIKDFIPEVNEFSSIFKEEFTSVDLILEKSEAGQTQIPETLQLSQNFAQSDDGLMIKISLILG